MNRLDFICSDLACKMGPDVKKMELVKAGFLYALGMVKDEWEDPESWEMDPLWLPRLKAKLSEEFL